MGQQINTHKNNPLNYWTWNTRRLLQEAATQACRFKLVRVFRVLRSRGIDPNTGRAME